MRPVDTDEIQAQITLLEIEKCDLDDQLVELESLKDQLSDLEQRRVSIESEIGGVQEELEVDYIVRERPNKGRKTVSASVLRRLSMSA